MREKISRQKVFWYAILSALLLFISIAEGQKIFAELWLLHRMVQVLAFLFFSATASWSIVFWFSNSRTVKIPYLPLAIHLFTVALIVILPINWLRNKIEFDVHHEEFSKAAAYIIKTEHEIKNHPQIDELPDEYKHLSLDGVVFVIHQQDSKGVFFFTFRGAPEGLSGYLKIQNPSHLQLYLKAISREEHLVAEDLGDNWYFVTSG